jgi:hypothetical protein
MRDLTMKELIAKETKRRTVSFWGVDHEIQPALCETILGDGLQLVYVKSMDNRPNYWIIRIDSKTDVEADDFDIETLLEPLEEEFGREPVYYCYNEEEFTEVKNDINHPGYNEAVRYDTFDEYEKAYDFPCVWWQGGFFGSIKNFGI